MNTTQLNQAVAQLLPAWQASARIEGLAPMCRPQTRAEAYALQQALFTAAGELPLGWKIAATSLAGQQHIGVSGPLAGRLAAARCLADGSELSLEHNKMSVIEAEFAFLMGCDVRATGTDPLSLPEVMACVSGLHIAIEVPNSRYIDFIGAGEAQLIADFACAGHIVLGPRVADVWQDNALKDHPVNVRRGAQVVARGTGSNVLGDPRLGLTWLANELLSQGQHLKAGELVMTGTCVVPVPVSAGETLTADFGEFGQVSVQFSA